MADILIRGMPIPKCCGLCGFFSFPSCGCHITGREIESIAERADFCPIVELPEHGDLIDRVAFRAEMDKHYPFTRGTQRLHGEADAAKSTVINMLANAPVIVPGNKEETE